MPDGLYWTTACVLGGIGHGPLSPGGDSLTGRRLQHGGRGSIPRGQALALQQLGTRVSFLEEVTCELHLGAWRVDGVRERR